MSVYRRQFLVGAGLAGLSGCLRLTDPEAGERTAAESTATPTPASETTATATATPTDRDTPTEADRTPEYPLGLSEDGPSKTLVAAHTSTLKSGSFRRNTKKINVAGGHIWHDTTYEYADGQALGQRPERSITAYHDAETSLWRQSVVDGYTYGRDPGVSPVGRAMDRGVFRTKFMAADWEASTITRRAFPGQFTVTATAADEPGLITQAYGDGAELLDFEAELVVDERGFVRRLDGTWSWRKDGERHRHRNVYTVSEFGSVSVGPPSWLATARERAPTASASFVDDRRLVKLVHESGNPLESGTRIWLEAGRDNPVARTRTESTIAQGDAVYIYRTTDGDAGLSIGDRPSGLSLATLDEEMLVKVHRTGVDYFEELRVA